MHALYGQNDGVDSSTKHLQISEGPHLKELYISQPPQNRLLRNKMLTASNSSWPRYGNEKQNKNEKKTRKKREKIGKKNGKNEQTENAKK